MRQDAGKQIKSSQRRYKDDQDQKARNVPLWLTAGQYIYFVRPPMTTSAAEHLATESFHKLMVPNTGTFKVIQVLRKGTTIDEDGIRNTVSIDRATLALLAKLAEGQTVYRPKSPSKKEATESTVWNDKLLRKKLLTRCKNTQSIAMCVMWTKAITFNTSCARTPTPQLTICQAA